MGCLKWMDAITDCALGQPPEPDLAAHLAICPLCQNALRDRRAMAARIEEALHRSAAVEPPWYGPERVMTRIHRPANARWWWKWAVAGSAMAAVVLIVIVMWARRPAPAENVTALSSWRSPTQSLLSPPVAAVWITTPRLGEGYFKMKARGEIHDQ